MRLTLSKSRDYLNDSKLASRSQEKFQSFKLLSKSQEVLSAALGRNMKRMNGAVSDISPANLPVNPRIYLDSPDLTTDNFVILPGSSVLMSHSDLVSIGGAKNFGSLQLLPISESGRSTPASQCSNATVADIPCTDPCNDHPNNTCTQPNIVAETLVEVSEEDLEEEDSKVRLRIPSNAKKFSGTNKAGQVESNQASLQSSRRRSLQENAVSRTFKQKEEKNNINYETKQSMSRSASVDGINNKNSSNNKLQTAEVAVQVNLTKCASSPSVNKQTNDKISEENFAREHGDIICPAYIPVDGNIRPGVERRLTRGFSHDDTLGGDEKRYSWREELEKFRSQKKPLGVSDLIDAFTNKTLQRKVSSDDPSFPSVDSMKNKRRGSLQIQIDSNAFAKLSETTESQKSNNAIKLQRRKSTSAILPLRLSEVKMPDIEEDASFKNKSDNSINEKYKNISEKAVSEINSDESEPNNEGSSESINAPYFNQSLPKGRVYLEKVNERKRTWDYFEINHPKAISDKKLEQLKAKYTRRKTEADILSKTESDKNHQNQILARKPAAEVKPLPVRTHSMPVIEASLESAQTKKPLELALDPLTGECLNTCDTLSIDSGNITHSLNKIFLCATIFSFVP